MSTSKQVSEPAGAVLKALTFCETILAMHRKQLCGGIPMYVPLSLEFAIFCRHNHPIPVVQKACISDGANHMEHAEDWQTGFQLSCGPNAGF